MSTTRHIVPVTVCLLAVLLPGCGSEPPPKTVDADDPPARKLPLKPAADPLLKAIEASDGDVEAALVKLGVRLEHSQSGRLRGVYLSGLGVTDESLERLNELPLEVLALSDNDITDKGLAHLSSMRHLTTLELNRTRVTNAGMKDLAKLPELTVLYLSGTQVGDAGLANLAGLRSLTMLTLSNTDLTDAGLEHLVEFENLGTLVLDGTGVTAAGLARLQDLPNLTHVYARGTTVEQERLPREMRSKVNR